MKNIVVPPPTMDSFAPEFCLCGKRTIQSHEFWFCSTQCARLDSLRSLGDPECHYRNVVCKAYVQAGIPELYPRRMMSVGHLRQGPSEPRSFTPTPSRSLLPTNASHQKHPTLTRRNAHDGNMAVFPTLAQVAGKVLTKKTTAGGHLVPVNETHGQIRREGFPNASSRGHPAQSPKEHTFEQISLDDIPLPDHIPARTLGHVPSSSVGLKNNIRKSVAALLNVGRSPKVKEGDNPERVFGHPVNTVVPPPRKESLLSHHQMSPPSGIPVQRSKIPRRSASFAGWDTTRRGGPSDTQDTLMHIVEEMRGECSESFDPRSLFSLEEPY